MNIENKVTPNSEISKLILSATIIIAASFSSVSFAKNVPVPYSVYKTNTYEISAGPIIGTNTIRTAPAINGATVSGSINTDTGDYSVGGSHNSSTGENKGTIGWGTRF